MDHSILTWLLEEENPEVRLRTLKEYEKLPEHDAQVIDCKKRLLQSKVYERGLKKLRTDKPWAKYDAILAFAEWGLTRADIGEDIDGEVFAMIENTGFKMLCGEPLLLRNLVKLGYGQEDIVKNEIDNVLGLIKEDGGFGCISTNKKINDPRKPHKSCARLTVEYLLLVAELHLQGYRPACENTLVHYFTKRNIFYRTDDMKTPMVDVMLGTFYPPDPIKIGAHQIVYALKVLGCAPQSEAMQAGYKVLDQHRQANGRYVLTASKSVPAFKVGNVGEENKWVTLYACMAQEWPIEKEGRIAMNASLLGLFSGFPTHHFTDEIARVLQENLSRRESLVFVSAWPEDYARNDDDRDGMHEMFAERRMAFARRYVIDRRTSAADAVKQIRAADCIFLMGGDPVLQMALIRDLSLVPELLASRAVILGVSAGSMNMGRYVADVWETKKLYEGIGLTDIVMKGHYAEDAWFIPVLKELSMTRPVAAMEDESAIFIKGDAIWKIGNIHWIDNGEIRDGFLLDVSAT